MEPSIAWWDWVGIGLGILGTVAFLMAVRPFTQEIWGRPRVDISFESPTVEGVKILRCHLLNYSANKWIRRLGVHRETADDVFAVYKLSEVGSGRILLPTAIPDILTPSGQSARHVSLPASAIPARFGVVLSDPNTGDVCTFEEPRITLHPGEYQFDVTVGVSERKFTASSRIVVQLNKSYFWAAH